MNQIFFTITCFFLSSFLKAELIFVMVGDPSNQPDSAGRGSVPYAYEISRDEISLGRYVEFLNSVARDDPNQLWESSSTQRTGLPGDYSYSISDLFKDKPVNISVPQILRFINWLHNGKPSGDQSNSTTENGAYSFYGLQSFTLRNVNATYWLPNENEWRKAAYYDPVAKSHRMYPHGDQIPVQAVGNLQGDVVNPSPITCVYGNTIWGNMSFSLFMSVGTSGSVSPWGTMDQAGNSWEIFEPVQPGEIKVRLHGGGYNSSEGSLRRTSTGANSVGSVTRGGFRVGRLAVGQPIDPFADSDGDGISDTDELILGTNPFVSDKDLFDRIKENPSIFGHILPGQLAEIDARNIVGSVIDQKILFGVEFQTSGDLDEWDTVAEESIEISAEGDKKFFRIKLKP